MTRADASASRTAAHLDQAHSLIVGGTPGAAVALLRRRLSRRNPYLAPVSAGIRDLAECYEGLAADDPPEVDTIGWAVYLHRAALRLDADADMHARDSAGSLLRPGEIVAARFSTAKVLHAFGQCEAAEREATAALSRWVPHHNDGPDVTYTYLVEALTLLDQCGRIKQGNSLFHAYGAMLPAAGTDEYALLRSHIWLKLGSRAGIQNHEEVCAVRLGLSRPRQRRSYNDLRTAILCSLAHGHDEPLSIPAGRGSLRPGT